MKVLVTVLLVGCVPAFGQFNYMPPGAAPAGGVPGTGTGAGQQAMAMMQQAQVQAMAASQAAMFAAQASAIQAQAAGRNASLMGMAAAYQGMVMGQAAMVQNMSQVAMLQGQIASYEGILRSQAMLGSMEVMRTQQMTNVAMLTANVARNNMLRMAVIARSRALLQAAAQGGQGGANAGGAAAGGGDAGPLLTPSPMMVRPTFGNPLEVSKPSFSVEGGKVQAGTKVKIKTDTHYSAVYYTTDGWTPTTQSLKYTGPITINETTHLQTVAVGPNLLRSQVNHADYVVEGSKPKELATVVVPADGVLRLGTPLRLETSGPDVTSATAAVGDTMTLVLDQDVKLGDKVLAAKGQKVEAVLTIADAESGRAPGDLVFEVTSIEVGGKKVALFASETMEGAAGIMSSKEAVIKAGMPVTAFVAADVSLKP